MKISLKIVKSHYHRPLIIPVPLPLTTFTFPPTLGQISSCFLCDLAVGGKSVGKVVKGEQELVDGNDIFIRLKILCD